MGNGRTVLELADIGRAHCKKNGWTFVFASEDELGFQTQDGRRCRITWDEVRDAVGEAQSDGRR